jgi:excinuclease ABC subunit B
VPDKKFKINCEFKPTGDQPAAIEFLANGILNGEKYQTLLGATGTGKTFTMANIVEKLQRPTLILTHNKTLAAQLCSEFQQFFPENAVGYFVSYYDYYQPEAYLPRTDTFIEKEATINEEIEKYRFAATNNLLTRRDTLIVATVSCIYGIGSPQDFEKLAVKISVGDEIPRDKFLRKLTEIQYRRAQNEFKNGMFSAAGDVVDIFPPDGDAFLRIEFFGDEIEKITEIDEFTFENLNDLKEIKIFPASHNVTTELKIEKAVPQIRKDLKKQVEYFKKIGKHLEAERIKTRVEFDIEMLLEVGHISGIENYTRYFSGRKPGEPPSCLLEFFPKDFLCFVDESHIAVPQIGGMFGADESRKKNLIEHGFRLPSAADNRPLKFPEFEKLTPQKVFVSATPGKFEFENCAPSSVNRGLKPAVHKISKEEFYTQKIKKLPPNFCEQIIRPTGLLDPEIEIRPTEKQVPISLKEIKLRREKNERVLITTLTKKSAERLADFLKENGVATGWLHSEVETFERVEILKSLREGKIEVLVGVNLLREGLDLPEVSLVLIFDADKRGFLRSRDALIQTMGRAARNANGKVILFADVETDAIREAIAETTRRREIQKKFNEKNGITPQTIIKKISDFGIKKTGAKYFDKKIKKEKLPKLIAELENKMALAVQNLEFEKAAELRDEIDFLQNAK